MKCTECGSDKVTVERPARFHYTMSGLPNVYLANGIELRRCASCGEEEVSIHAISKLHLVIVRSVIDKPARLAGSEVKFLRKSLGWSGTDFAKHIGVAPETVSRWENDADQIGGQADRALRLMAAYVLPSRDYSMDALEFENKEAPPLKVTATTTSNGWELVV